MLNSVPLFLVEPGNIYKYMTSHVIFVNYCMGEVKELHVDDRARGRLLNMRPLATPLNMDYM